MDRANMWYEGRGLIRRNPNWWSPSMTHMHEFFLELFKHPPPLVFRVGGAKKS
jgi:hypothetical protein